MRVCIGRQAWLTGHPNRFLMLGLASLLLALVVLAVAISQRDPEGRRDDGSRRPDSPREAVIDNGCPGPIPAYAESGFFYTPEHPLIPPASDKPDRCFRSIADARTAGFVLAPPPAGWRDLGGVYVRPAPKRLTRGCADAARRLHLNLLCSTLTPEPGVPLTCSDRRFGGCVSRGRFQAVGGFAVQGVAFEGIRRAPFNITLDAGPNNPRLQFPSCISGRSHRRLIRLGEMSASLGLCEAEDRLSVGLLWSQEGVSYRLLAGSTILDEDLATPRLRRIILRLLRLIGTQMEPAR
jgi:hypothetical protein